MVFAFVTLVTSDAYLPGALVVASALRDLHSTPAEPPEVDFQTVCLVSPETVDVKTIKLLRRAFNVVIGVEVVAVDQSEGLDLLGRPDLDTVLTKLHMLRLTQFEKIIFLDADVLPLRPMSHLFTLPHDFAAVPDVGWPDIFNSGVMVFTPGEDKFNEVMKLVHSKGSWDGGDQGVLNEWRGDRWHRLSFKYNTTPTAAYTYAPAYERFGSSITAIHFIGTNKPWLSIPYRAPGSSKSSHPPPSTSQSYGYSDLVDRWFSVYDRHFRPVGAAAEQLTEFQKYASAWDEDVRNQNTSGALSLDELKRLAIEGVGSSGIVGQAPTTGEGEYYTLPLDGRVDLIRPPRIRPPPPPEVSPAPLQVTHSPPPEAPPAPVQRTHSPPPVSPAPPHRPPSPSKIIWNPAVEPPPKDPPAPSQFPINAYFPNAWDQPRLQHYPRNIEEQHVHRDQQFFQAPAPTRIPTQLIQQREYSAVTSDAAHPKPDRARVTTVFPWEEKPRQAPTRYFPRTDSPPPGQFMEPPKPQSGATRRFDPIPLYQPATSPSHGLGNSAVPLALQYGNAWDHVPSIQKYATHLMRPPMPPAPAPAEAAASGGRRHKQSDSYPPWDDVEESSRDGDVEDEESDSDRSTLRTLSSPRDSDSGKRTISSPPTSIAPTLPGRSEKSRSRRGSRAGTGSGSKDYRSQATQTPIKEMRDSGVQAIRRKSRTLPSAPDDAKLDGKQPKADSGMFATHINVPPGFPPPVTRNAHLPGSGTLSPRLHDSYAYGLVGAAAGAANATRPESQMDDVALSPASSGTASPRTSSTVKPVGRSWDPARGVDVFKRGSEEVLARFLRQDSWEEGSKRTSPPAA